MSYPKTTEEIDVMREGGHLLSASLQKAIDAIKEGVTLRQLDKIAEDAIRAGGGEPSFLGYKSKITDEGFPSAVCISVNDEVVHGSGRRDVVLRNGDLVGLDIGCWYKGLCTDMAATVPVGGFERLPKNHKALLTTTRASLMAGIGAVKVGGYIHDISKTIEEYINEAGKYGIVRSLVGHGVGHKIHEDPHVPNFVSNDFPECRIVNNMCLAIEPMVTLGAYKVETGDDGWTIKTVDGSLSAHF
ncbi:MAG: type I methionyl aminopeptidase [Patescibacteria group bacterium]